MLFMCENFLFAMTRLKDVTQTVTERRCGVSAESAGKFCSVPQIHKRPLIFHVALTCRGKLPDQH